MRKRISMDLDNTIFNLAEKYRAVIESHNFPYVPPTSYNVYKNGYPKEIADALYDMLRWSDEIYKTRVFDARIPATLNAIYNDSRYCLFYITERDPDVWNLQQLHDAGIVCPESRLIHCVPKIDALKKYKIDLCFDDSPNVVSGCLDSNIDVVMISNADTAYNHHLRGRVENYPDLMTALIRRGFAQQK